MRLVTQRDAVTVVSVMALAAIGSPNHAQQPEGIRIDTLSVADTLYHLSGGGGNALALVDEINGGIVLIDAKSPGWGPSVSQVLESVTDLPVTTIINTHAHAEHAGGNPGFPTATQIVAHQNTRDHMARMDLYRGGNSRFLPNTTFTETLSLLDGLDRVELHYFGPAHTDGDIIVVFPEKGVAYVGDLFPYKGTPVIDTERGGSGVAFPDTLAKAVAGIQGVNRVITGHAPFPSTYAGRGRQEQGNRRPWSGWMTWNDFSEYAEFTRDFLAAVEEAFRSGRRADEAAATLTLPDRYRDYAMDHAEANVEAIYAELAGR